jgi:putative transposase
MAKHRTKGEIAVIVKAIEKQRGRGVPLADCCKAQGVSEQSYYRWRTAAAADKDDTARELREVTIEAERLRRALADVMLDNQMLREVAKKKW